MSDNFSSFLFVCFFVFAVRGPLTAVASPVAEHRLRTRRLSGHGSRAQSLRGMWDLPRPEHEPVSPASAGGLSTTALPGKPKIPLLFNILHHPPPRLCLNFLSASKYEESTSAVPPRYSLPIYILPQSGCISNFLYRK